MNNRKLLLALTALTILSVVLYTIFVDEGQELRFNSIEGWQEAFIGLVNVGQFERARRLVEQKNAPLNMPIGGLYTPLHIAISHGDLGLVQTLLAKRVDWSYLVEFENVDLITSFHLAVIRGNLSIIKLLRPYFDISVRSKMGRTPLMYSPTIKVLNYLWEEGGDLDIQDEEGMTALHWAVELSQTEIVKRLLKYGANTDLKASYFSYDYDEFRFGWEPLHIAVKEANYELIEIMLDYADINAITDDGLSVLSLAVSDKRRDVVELLIEEGVDLQGQTKEYWLEQANDLAVRPKSKPKI